MQFPAALFSRELPVDGRAFAVDAALPGMNFALQCGQVTDSALSQALAAQQVRFDFQFLAALSPHTSPYPLR
jgi:hypothetical protein